MNRRPNNNNNNSSIDWLELDRLVDGRLSDDDYRELLCQIDADPNGWKQCAMAFLEHQALEKELGAFAADPSCQMLPSMGAILTGKQNAAPAIDQTDNESLIEPKPTPMTAPRSFTGSMIGWLSMALCIVSGLALGFTINSSFRDTTMPTATSSGSIIAEMSNHADLTDQVLMGSSETLVGRQNKKANGCNSGCGGKHPCSGRIHLENLTRGIRKHDPACSGGCPVSDSLLDGGKSSGCSSKNDGGK